MPLTEEKIREIVEAEIQKNEKLGDQGGGSGHISHVSFRIDDINSRSPDSNRIEISYSYTLMTETEFTYYPDNPPYETSCSAIIIVNSNTGELFV